MKDATHKQSLRRCESEVAIFNFLISRDESGGCISLKANAALIALGKIYPWTGLKATYGEIWVGKDMGDFLSQ